MKTAVLGGTFDPVHSEHIAIALKAKERYGFDRVILEPTFNPPHKHCRITPYDERLTMLRLASEEYPFIEVDETEKEMALDHAYSYLVLAELKRKFATDELTYLIGSDSLMKFTEWRNPDKVAALIPILAVPRGEVGEEAEAEAVKLNSLYESADISVADFTCEEVSSSVIKLYLELKDYAKAARYVPEKALRYIESKGLYSFYAPLTERLKSEMSERLFAHTVRTAEFAVGHAWSYDVDFDSAFLAAMLHDSRKQCPPLHPAESYDTLSKEVIHQYDGAEAALDVYGVKDERIIDAIRYHTTGKPDMSALGKLIFIADKLEAGRSYEGVEELRALADKDIEACFRALLRHNYEYLKCSGAQIDPLTSRAYAWYNIAE